MNFELIGISEEFVRDKDFDNHCINIIYKTFYDKEIDKVRFKGLEEDWINFEWVDINILNDINIFHKEIKQCISNSNQIHHLINNLLN